MDQSMRGTTLVNVWGMIRASFTFCRVRLFPRLVARMKAFSVMFRRMKSNVYAALFFLIGPPMLPFQNRFLYGGNDDGANNGLRALSLSLLNCVDNCPWIASALGFVRISTRLLPGESYSAEYGFELIRISRIEDFGGTRPSVKPSV